MKKNQTRRALLLSALSLLLCVSMLVGSTFAWFTDSVTSAGNKIKAGNLDIELHMFNGTEYADISNNVNPIFGGENSLSAQNVNADTLWEPGKTQVAYLKIVNNGSLALKYTVALDVTNVSKDLYKVMKYDIVENATNAAPVTAWNGGNSVVEGVQSVSGDVSLAAGGEHYFALAIHMDEAAGNEYQNGQVNFDLTILATQDTVEADSFNNQYDVFADYDGEISNAASLNAALANGGTYKVLDDIQVSETLELPANVEVALNLNGNAITGAGVDDAGNKIHTLKNYGTLTLVGGTIASTADNGGAAVYNYGDLTLEDVTIQGAPNGSTGNATYPLSTAGAGSKLTINSVDVTGRGGIAATNGAKVVVNGGTFHVPSVAYGHAIYASGEGTEVTINGGTFSEGFAYANDLWGTYQIYSGSKAKVIVNGGDFSQEWDCANGYDLCTDATGVIEIKGGTFADNPANQNRKNFVADGYDVLKKEQANGDEYYTVLKGDVRYPSVAASANGEYRFEGEGANRLDDCYFVVPAGDYTDKGFFSQEFAGGNVFDGENATFADVQVLGNYCTDADDVFTVKNVSSNGKLTVGVSGGTIVIDNCNVKAMRISGASKIIVKNSTINGYGENRNGDNGGYGMYIIPAGNYELSVLNNTINNCDMHCIAVQANGAGAVEVKGNDFKAWGSATNKTERAAFKIWGDTVLAPTNMSSYNDLGNEAKALVADILANNTFPADLTAIGGTGTQVIFDFYDAAFSAAE